MQLGVNFGFGRASVAPSFLTAPRSSPLPFLARPTRRQQRIRHAELDSERETAAADWRFFEATLPVIENFLSDALWTLWKTCSVVFQRAVEAALCFHGAASVHRPVAVRSPGRAAAEPEDVTLPRTMPTT